MLLSLFQYNDLMKKKKIVEDDKKKIEEVIQELDMKKNEALQKAWEQVNKVNRGYDFCSFYRSFFHIHCQSSSVGRKFVKLLKTERQPLHQLLNGWQSNHLKPSLN